MKSDTGWQVKSGLLQLIEYAPSAKKSLKGFLSDFSLLSPDLAMLLNRVGALLLLVLR